MKIKIWRDGLWLVDKRHILETPQPIVPLCIANSSTAAVNAIVRRDLFVQHKSFISHLAVLSVYFM